MPIILNNKHHSTAFNENRTPGINAVWRKKSTSACQPLAPTYRWVKKVKEGLNGIVGLKEPVPGLKNIPVLLQSDVSAEGLQACGLHTLKNALLAVFVQKAGPKTAELFKDQELYDIFYDKYCEPVLSRFKEKDASIAVVRQIYADFLKDINPPEKLQKIQKILKEKPASIVMFNMTSKEGERLFGTMDTPEVMDAVQLYRFANEKGPCSIVCLCGDQLEGHWMTMIIEKDTSGVFSFKSCDSMGDLNMSSLLQLKDLLTETVKNPDFFMKKAYSNLEDTIDRWTGWVEEAGRTANKGRLLDTKPNDLLKTSNTDGSEKQRAVDHLLKSCHIIKACNWFKKLDFTMQLSLLRIEKVMQFYLSHMDKDDPQRALLQEAFKEISEKRIKDFVEQISDYEKARLQSYQEGLPVKDKIPEAQFTRLIELFDFMKVLYQSKREIAQGKDKADRNKIANDLIRDKLHVEAGIEESSGEKPLEAETQWEESIYKFLQNYQYVKETGKLHELCSKLTTPCLTGRLDAINAFVVELQFGIEDKPDQDIYETTKAIVAGTIEDCIVSDQNIEDDAMADFIQTINVETFKREEYQTDLIDRFEKMGESEKLAGFIQFLKDKDIWGDGDWNQIIPQFMQMPEFATMVAQGKQQALVDIG